MSLSLSREWAPSRGVEGFRARQPQAQQTLWFGLQSSLSFLYKVTVLLLQALLTPLSAHDWTHCPTWETSGLHLRRGPNYPSGGAETTSVKWPEEPQVVLATWEHPLAWLGLVSEPRMPFPSVILLGNSAHPPTPQEEGLGAVLAPPWCSLHSYPQESFSPLWGMFWGFIHESSSSH